MRYGFQDLQLAAYHWGCTLAPPFVPRLLLWKYTVKSINVDVGIRAQFSSRFPMD